MNSELFNSLRQTYGTSYEPFLLGKLVPVAGDVCEPNLGLDEDLTDFIAKEVDVVVNSAANTTFDERYAMCHKYPFQLQRFLLHS